jgi:hypothetical protein
MRVQGLRAGVIGFSFTFSNFYQSDFTQQNACCILAKSNEDAYAKTGLKIGPSLIYLCLSEVRVCWVLN